MRHWLLNVARRAGHPAAADLEFPASTPLPDAWARVARACGLTDAELARQVAAHFRLPVADLQTARTQALRLVPDEIARRHRVFPLRENDRQIVVATADPTDVEAEQAVGFASGRRPEFVIATPAELDRLIAGGYSAARGLAALLENVGGLDVDEGDVKVLQQTGPEVVSARETEEAPVVRLTSLVIREAVRVGASDVHIEPGSTHATVRYRVDGVLRQAMQIPMSALVRVVSRIKIMADMDIADRMRPQDGRVKVQVEGRAVDLRVSTVPLRDHEKVVMRILDPQSSRTLSDLSLGEGELARFQNLIGNRDGLVIVTGPTGSGKTTTLYAALRQLATGEVNVVAIEDPVEYELAGVNQIQVETRRGVTFGTALRAVLRQDPDVILVGEIRDLETAQVAAQAAMTGHLVLASLHTNEAVGAVTRLVDLGLDRATLAEALRGVVAQRLIRRVCAACATRVGPDASAEETRLGALFGAEPVVRAVGCELCGGNGYRGRIPVVEVLAAGRAVQELIAGGASAGEIEKAAIAGGMRPLLAAALDRVARGDTTLREVERVLGEAQQDDRPAAAGGPRVLLVDDDEVVRSLARTMLEPLGYRVDEAGDGQAALEAVAAAGDYRLVVLDLDMPRLDGREVLRRLRGSLLTATLPVVILTGAEDEAVEARLMDEGADDYIRKPIEPARLVARVKAVLRRSGG